MLTLNQTGVEHENRSRKTCVLLNEVVGGMSCESWGTLRVQVPNNHILPQKPVLQLLLPQSQVPNYWVHGP